MHAAAILSPALTGHREGGPILGALRLWRGRRAFRRQLWRLLRDKPELLGDIGLTIEAARAEVRKPFWLACCTEGKREPRRG